ncbi:MAG: hypothetical protein HYR51_08305 [Candidatus Rokubacteria bacterium]|nr:hypothetical protein [Candidatus Rokubacteria bacterium]
MDVGHVRERLRRLGHGRSNRLDLTHELRFPHSVGLLYSVFTAWLGFEVNEGEYKVMGRAPFGEPRHVDKVRELLELRDDGSLWLDPSYFSFQYHTEQAYTAKFEKLFGPPRAPMLKRLVASVGPHLAVMAVTLVALDVVCNLFGLFPPTYVYGDRNLGWLGHLPKGRAYEDECRQLTTGQTVKYLRNEDGVRTSQTAAQIFTDRDSFKVAVTGDSQTDLCAPNAETHPGFLEGELRARGKKAVVLPYGVGGYSPVQDYLAYKMLLKRYRPDALVVNFYTGNDFNDLLRIDDRPHFVRVDGRYELAEPVWYRYNDPDVQRRSRVLFLAESLAKKTKVQDLVLRLQFLYPAAAAEDQGVPAVLGYMNDLRRAIEPALVYREAFAAQMLNQQLFFHRFPRSREESVNRVRALLQLVRAENPDTLLVLSAVPSYQLVQEQPVDAALLRTLERLPITYEAGVQQEAGLYETLRRLAGESGWVFVDTLPALRAHRGGERLYNDADYHLLPAASRIIVTRQADTILEFRRSRSRQPVVTAAR